VTGFSPPSREVDQSHVPLIEGVGRRVSGALAPKLAALAPTPNPSLEREGEI
jgi:hypothetical protein